VLKLGHFRNQIRNAWDVLKYDAAMLKKIGCTSLVKNKAFKDSRRKGTSYIQQKKEG
jgi:hypothetical protein